MVILVLTVITAILCEAITKKLIPVFHSKPWWPQAAGLQKALMMNFGYPEEACTDDALIDGYVFVIVICGHHFTFGSAMIPVVYQGWEAAGSIGQAMFVFACLADVAFDIYDWLKKFVLTFFPSKFSFLGVQCPVAFFVILCILHHSLAMFMIVPLVVTYPSLPAFRNIAISLLLAAGICFTTGSYKFTLDVTSKNGFMQYKAIVLMQLVTILFTRGFVWFSQVYAALVFFYTQGAMMFFYGGCVGAGLMSLFNIIMILDAVGAAAKWLPKPMPQNDDEHHEVKVGMVRSQTSQMGFGSERIVGKLSPSAKAFRANVKVAVAVSKFKKLSHHEKGQPLLS